MYDVVVFTLCVELIACIHASLFAFGPDCCVGACAHVQFVWGNDREIITFDDAGSAYLGKVAAVDGTTLHLTDDARAPMSSEWGGWDGAAISILNGTGVGTWRRVTDSGIGGRNHPGEQYNPNNRTWKIDRPFGVDVTQDQVVAIVPARSRIIFENDNFVDGGTFQFYGQAQARGVCWLVHPAIGAFLKVALCIILLHRRLSLNLWLVRE